MKVGTQIELMENMDKKGLESFVQKYNKRLKKRIIAEGDIKK